MTPKEEVLVRKIEKAGIKKSREIGHQISEEELRDLKIQIVPRIWRIVIALIGFAFAAAASFCFKADANQWGTVWAIASFLFFLFALFGVRSLIDTVLESTQYSAADLIIQLAFEGIGAAAKAIFNK